MNCLHINEFKKGDGIKSLEIIFKYFTSNTTLNYHKAIALCYMCKNYNNGRLMACGSCIFFACAVKHAEQHALHKGHYLAVELSNGHIYCHGCKDYVYDSDLEGTIQKSRQIVTHSSDNCTYYGPPRYLPWSPSPGDIKILQKHPVRIKVESSTRVGMRGLVNLGSTCYMNCIMQAFLHTPMLRDFFFSDRHKCYGRKSKDCLFCHFGKLFQQYYQEDSTNISLHEILYLVWQNDPTISGNGQKDVHEFFISVLNLLLLHSIPPFTQNNPSVIDLIFHGNMQSDVVCQTCGNVSTKIDPFSDISLDIPDEPKSEADLVHYLYHFTKEELLGLSAEFRCSICQEYQESTKQLTFKLLPFVIVIHLKRFEHVNFKRKKKSHYVSFPTELDMSPFTSNLRNQANITKSKHSIGDNRYNLYAVVVHIGGTLDTGHYLAYIRKTKESWFKCNDVQVVPADSSEVMASEAYLLFYHKTVLSYR